MSQRLCPDPTDLCNQARGYWRHFAQGWKDTNTFIAWSKQRGGPYMPTPLVYGDLLYTCSNQGVLTAYNADTASGSIRSGWVVRAARSPRHPLPPMQDLLVE